VFEKVKEVVSCQRAGRNFDIFWAHCRSSRSFQRMITERRAATGYVKEMQHAITWSYECRIRVAVVESGLALKMLESATLS
jgi:hypothetical protein